MATYAPLESRCHAFTESRCHQRRGRGTPQFEVFIGAKLWLGIFGFHSGHFNYWKDILVGDPWTTVRPYEWVGPLYGLPSYSVALGSPNQTGTITWDRAIDDNTDLGNSLQNLPAVSWSGFGGEQSLFWIDADTGEFFWHTSHPGALEDQSDTAFTFQETVPGGVLQTRSGSLSNPIALGDVYADELSFGQSNAGGFGSGLGTITTAVKNTDFFAATVPTELQIGRNPDLVTHPAYYVQWGHLPQVFHPSPGAVYKTTEALTDGASQSGVLINVAGGYMVSKCVRSAVGSILIGSPWGIASDVPWLMGTRVRGVGKAALATYKSLRTGGFQRTSVVDVNYGNQPTIISPVLCTSSDSATWQVLFPNRKASEIGRPGDIWK